MSDLFKVVKEKVQWSDILELKESGGNWTTEDDLCPICGHQKDFVVYEDSKTFKCFGGTGGQRGDIIEFYRITQSLETPYEAATAMASRFKLNVSKGGGAPPRKVASTAFDVIAAELHERLLRGGGAGCLTSLTPLQYQLQKRKHTQEALDHFLVGWTGEEGLLPFLEQSGIDPMENGFAYGNKPSEVFPKNVFIYPLIFDGRVVYFTTKDPLKEKEYNMRRAASKDSRVLFYNQRTLLPSEVYVVEGQNDVISLWEAGVRDVEIWGTNGSLSQAQVKCLQNIPVVKTIFDKDAAGDAYRAKVTGIHYLIPQTSPEKDIDDFLKNGNALSDLEQVVVRPQKTLPVVEKNGCYYKVKETKEGSFLEAISDFTIRVEQVIVYQEDDHRNRMVKIVRDTGYSSESFEVTSEQKVSVSAFRRAVADRADGTFLGSETDLAYVWMLVYREEPSMVLCPPMVGYLDRLDAWLFRDVIIGRNRLVYKSADEMFWPEGSSGVGYISRGLSDSNSEMDVPSIVIPESWDEVGIFEKEFLSAFAQNRDSVLTALICLGWLKGSLYTPYLFKAKELESFPFLYFAGDSQSGKTHIAGWLTSFFGDMGPRFFSAATFGSGAGLMRKLGYFSNMPFFMDDFRNSEIKDTEGYFRGFFHRAPKILASSLGVARTKEQKVLTNFIMTGQDEFNDVALKSRCIIIYVDKKVRPKDPTFMWLNENRHRFSQIMAHAIFSGPSWEEVGEGMSQWRQKALDLGCQRRAADNWRLMLPFMTALRDKYFPEFDMEKALSTKFLEENQYTGEDSLISGFFEDLTFVLCSSGSTKVLNVPVCKLEGDFLYLPLRTLLTFVEQESRAKKVNPVSFTILKNQFKSQSYCLEVSHKARVSGVTLNCIVLKWGECPEYVKTFVDNVLRVEEG